VGGSSRLPGHLPGITRFQVRCPVGLSAAVVSLSKKLYSHCLSHPAVKPVKYCILCVIRAQLKSSFIADVIPVKKSQRKKKEQSKA